MKKLLTAIMITTLCLVNVGFAFASTSEAVSVDIQDLKISQKQEAEFEKFSDGLAEELKKCDSTDAMDAVIKEFTAKNPISQLFNKSVKNYAIDENLPESNVVLDKTIFAEHTKQYVINDETTLIVYPGGLFLDTLEVKDVPMLENEMDLFKPSPITPMATAAYSQKTVAGRRADYDWMGTRVCSVHVSGTFQYNGSKAIHKSGFDAYALNDNGTTKYSNLTKWNEASGTSHLYACRANFSRPWVENEFTLKVSIYCHKDGSVTKKYIPALD